LRLHGRRVGALGCAALAGRRPPRDLAAWRNPERHAMKCSGTSRAGAPCRWPRWGSSAFCLNHASAAGELEAVAEQRRRCLVAHAKMAERSTARRRKACSLRTEGDLLHELEVALLAVARSKESAIARANATTRIVAEAHAILSANLERTATEINELLDAHPELAQRIRAVQ
jgi:hypothetical protein